MILPFNIDTIIHSQCWTFNRMAIIENEPYGYGWVVSKYNIFLDENYKAYFDDLDIYNYYGSMFLIKTIELKLIKSVVEYFKTMIKQEFYLSICCDYRLLGWDTAYQEQELLFYGFNDNEKIFYLTQYNMKNNKYEKTTITYNKLLEIINKLKNNTSDVEYLQTILTSKYLTLIKPRKQELDINIILVECLKKNKNRILLL